MNNIIRKKFKEINLKESFFDSLRADYCGFDDWFIKKSNEYAYVQYNEKTGDLIAFLYLKIEENKVEDVVPQIEENRILKIGTFKIEAHKTKLGEQFVKVILDYALKENVNVCYATIFSKQIGLIKLITQFGFELYGEKGEGRYKENVYLKTMKKVTGNINKDYPFIDVTQNKKYILSIYPKYHTVMFPDSILCTETTNIIKDVSYTNSIHKIYVCTMKNIENLKYGDIVVLYRTAENDKSAEYSSVVTSICVVEDVKHQNDFNSFDDFYEYSCQYSVFEKEEFKYWYKKGNCKVIKMTYNVALKKRLTRHELIENIGLNRNDYWGFFELSDKQFFSIVKKSEVGQFILSN